MLGMLIDAHAAARLQFFGDYQHLADTRASRAYLKPLWTTDWFGHGHQCLLVFAACSSAVGAPRATLMRCLNCANC
jgi:hypothetical protein